MRACNTTLTRKQVNQHHLIIKIPNQIWLNHDLRNFIGDDLDFWTEPFVSSEKKCVLKKTTPPSLFWEEITFATLIVFVDMHESTTKDIRNTGQLLNKNIIAI